MFQSVRRALVQGVEKTWNTLASHTGDGKGDQLWDNETNLYRREILINGQLLGDNQDVEVRIEAVRKIGHLAYTGKLLRKTCNISKLYIIGMLVNVCLHDSQHPCRK